MMSIVGITGHSGSGKSSVARYYASLGYPTADGDEISRFVCAPDSPCVVQLSHAFGQDIVDETGALLRRKLAERAYASAAMNKMLVDIVHPFVMQELENREKIAQKAGAVLFFLDGAMIVGSIFEAHCHRIIVVESERRLSVSRIILRDGISKSMAHNRLDAQKSNQELRSAADYILENNGTEGQLEQKADSILQDILQLVALSAK